MKKTLLLLMVFIYLGSYAQNNESDKQHHCGLYKAYKILEKEGTLDAYHLWHDNHIKELQENFEKITNRSLHTVYNVPVVVHVVWGGEHGINVTDEQVQIMLNNLNKDYARLNDDADITRPEFTGVASSVDIQFCLAKTDPNGETTTGIVRTQSDHGRFDPRPASQGGADNSDDIKYTANGGDDAWDTNLYLNIWIGDLTDGEGQGIMGYSTLPGSHGSPSDGFIMDCVNVANEQIDRTATHEIGHYFGLYHPWGPGIAGSPGINGGGCDADDGFTDTPNTNDQLVGTGCDDAPFNCGSLDQRENYMCYSNCTNMFTQQQAASMKLTLETTRASLLNNKCLAPTLIANFLPSTPTITIDAGQSVDFEDLSSGPIGVNSWNWTFTGGTPSSSETGGMQTITYNTPGLYPVSLTVGDANGDNNTKTVSALVEVIDVINANFQANITYAELNQTITFTDLSSGPNPISSWAWDFGDGSTSNEQNPVHSYNNIGFYTVKLVIEDGQENNTEIKTEYIHVYDPNALNIIDFTGNPTTINAGEQVTFTLETNQSDNLIDSIRWILHGANETYVYKENTNPFNATYSTGGIFDVEARIYKTNNPNDGDTLIKKEYIIVISPENTPTANFSASNTNIPIGTEINFLNLTTNIEQVDSIRWIIETDAGQLETNEVNPQNISYNTVGDYTVSLEVQSPFGDHDTTKVNYIHVFDPDNLGSIKVNFEAVTGRLITVGETVRFEDLSVGDIENWTYIFDRGAGIPNLEYSTQQNPEHVFTHAGHYDVTLIASNSSFADTVLKDSYIIVTTTEWPDKGGYCDTISAMKDYEIETSFREITTEPEWGIFPGHCALLEDGGSTPKMIKQYAQKFETYQPDYISGVLIPVAKVFSGDEDAEIRVRVWDADENGRPNKIISGSTSSNKVKLTNFEEKIYNYIELDKPVNVDSVFFVGFRLDYRNATSPQDTFATYITIRDTPAENTLFISRIANLGPWQTPSEFFEPDIYAAMDIRLISCIVSVEEIEKIENQLILYPNPSNNGNVFADFGTTRLKDINLEVYDIVGKKSYTNFHKISDNKLKIDLSNNENGIYFIRFNVNGYKITKKILLNK